MALQAVDNLIANLKSGYRMLDKIHYETKTAHYARRFLTDMITGFYTIDVHTMSKRRVIDQRTLNALHILIYHYRIAESQSKEKLTLTDFLTQLDTINISCDCPVYKLGVIRVGTSKIEVNTNCTLQLRSKLNRIITRYNDMYESFCEDNQLDIFNILPNIDVELLEFMVEQAKDKYYLDELITQLDCLFSLPLNVISPELRPLAVRSEMVNINYSVGFKIKLTALCNLIENTDISCRARFNPLYDKHLTIYFPCTSQHLINQYQMFETNNETELANVKQRYCILLVYGTGQITQSNPTEQLALEARYLFLSLIEMIAGEIKLQ